MKFVRAGVRNNVHNRAAVAPILRREIRLQIKFLYRFERQNRRGCTANSRLIECRVVEERVVVVCTIEQVVVGPVTIAVDVELPESKLRARDTRGIDRRTRDQRNEFPEVTSIQRELGDETVRYHFA